MDSRRLQYQQVVTVEKMRAQVARLAEKEANKYLVIQAKTEYIAYMDAKEERLAQEKELAHEEEILREISSTIPLEMGEKLPGVILKTAKKYVFDQMAAIRWAISKNLYGLISLNQKGFIKIAEQLKEDEDLAHFFVVSEERQINIKSNLADDILLFQDVLEEEEVLGG